MKSKDPTAQWKFWRVPQLDNLELLHGSNITHYYPLHMHEEYCIALMLKGTETTTCRGESFTACAGDLALLNPEELHSSESIESTYRIIRIRPEVLRRIDFELGGPSVKTPCFPQIVVSDPSIFRSLLNLHLKLEEHNSTLEQETEFITTIGRLLRRQLKPYPALPIPGNEPRHIKRLRDYLRAHYAENVSLSQLTSIVNLSPFYLLRVFHQEVGFPPHEYQTQVRIAHARKLLLEGRTISQTALETGFYDQSHLSRNFKRIVGLTPGQYVSQRNIVQDAGALV